MTASRGDRARELLAAELTGLPADELMDYVVELRDALRGLLSPVTSPLPALRDHVDDLAAWVAIWEARSEPDAHARRCAADAVAAIDGTLRELHQIRARLIGEIRAADDATAQRADAMLRGERGVR